VAAALVLAAIGVVAILVEVFVPAAGLLGIAGAASLVAAVAVAFARVGPAAGWGMLLITVAGVPLLLLAALRLFPESRAGRWLVLRHTQAVDAGYSTRDPGEAAGLVGRDAVALTDLRPVGSAEIDGRRCSVVTDGEYVDRGSRVRVVRVEGNRIVVRGG
jgi:membrane-bound serine protease (ClpP class)